jgi:hypothetical protein
MRDLYKSVQYLYEVRKNIDQVNDKVDTTQTTTGGDEVIHTKMRDNGGYSPQIKRTSIKTELGTYHGTNNGLGHHSVRWEPHQPESPMNASSKIRMLTQMNVAHNKYRDDNVKNYDTMAVSKGVGVSPKLSKFLQRHKDFHAPKIADDKITKDTIKDGSTKATKKLNSDDRKHHIDKMSADNAVLRTTFIPHPKTSKPISTSDRNEYQQNNHSNITNADVTLKDRYTAQQKDKRDARLDKVKSILNKKLF